MATNARSLKWINRVILLESLLHFSACIWSVVAIQQQSLTLISVWFAMWVLGALSATWVLFATIRLCRRRDKIEPSLFVDTFCLITSFFGVIILTDLDALANCRHESKLAESSFIYLLCTTFIGFLTCSIVSFRRERCITRLVLDAHPANEVPLSRTDALAADLVVDLSHND